MRKELPSRSTILRYSLIQIPAAALLAVVLMVLHRRLSLSPWIGWGIFLAWIVKDAALFPLVWRSYQPGEPSGAASSMAGLIGRARTDLSRRGKVEVRGEIWHAELPEPHPPVASGEAVRVVSSRGMTLQVEPVSAPPGKEAPPLPSRERA